MRRYTYRDYLSWLVVPNPDTRSIWLNEDRGVNSSVGFSVDFCDTGTAAT